MSSTGLGPAWTLADRLRKVRRDLAGMPQSKFAVMLGVNPATYAAWEGGRSRPRKQQEQDLADRIASLWQGRVSALWVLGLQSSAESAVVEGGCDWVMLAEGLSLPRLDSNQQPSDWRPKNQGALVA